MPDNLVLTDASDPQITLLTLNRPQKRNALSLALINQLHQSITQASADPTRRVIILCANGPSFCAGLDLAEAADPQLADKSAHALADLYLSLCQSPLITIAAAQGAAFGGGAGLIGACDLAVAADNLQIGYPEVHRGLVAALVSCLLRRQIGDRTAREILLLGQTLPAPRALSLGLVTQIVPEINLHKESLTLREKPAMAPPPPSPAPSAYWMTCPRAKLKTTWNEHSDITSNPATPSKPRKARPPFSKNAHQAGRVRRTSPRPTDY